MKHGKRQSQKCIRISTPQVHPLLDSSMIAKAMSAARDDAAARATDAEPGEHLPAPALERRLRSLEDEIAAAKSRIRALEDHGAGGPAPSRPGADARAAGTAAPWTGAPGGPAGAETTSLATKTAAKATTHPTTKRNKKKKKQKKETGKSKWASAGSGSALIKMTALLIPTALCGQGILKEKDYLVGQRKGLERAATAVGQSLRRVFGSIADSKAGKEGILGHGRPSPIWKTRDERHIHAGAASATRRAQEAACAFCPGGMAVAPDSVIPDADGITCGDLEALASPAESDLCSDIQLAQLFCCPGDGAPASAEPLASSQEATCVFCPEGVTAAPDLVIPEAGGVTCADVEAAAPYVEGEDCYNIQFTQLVCCPFGASASNDPTDGSSASVIPTASPPPSSPWVPVEQCPLPDNQVCGCRIRGQSDYRGTINVTKTSEQCLHWDSDFVKFSFGGVDLTEQYDGMTENHCRNPTGFGDKAYCGLQVPGAVSFFHWCDVPVCDPCSCVPACGEPNPAACGCPEFHQSEICCAGAADETTCKCDYLKVACQKSLQNNGTEFCALAEEACCKGNADPWCGCNVYEQICTENPFKFACDFAAESCCNKFDGADSYVPRQENIDILRGDDYFCECQFFTYAKNELDYVEDQKLQEVCDFTKDDSEILSDNQLISLSNGALQTLYTEMGGDYWFQNDGWADAASQFGEGETWDVGDAYCTWHGVTCNEKKLVAEINLGKNNLTGTLLSITDGFKFLVRLDISQNKITGEEIISPMLCAARVDGLIAVAIVAHVFSCQDRCRLGCNIFESLSISTLLQTNSQDTPTCC